jgi:starch-binding outer membrane protein, SusD/RagB family
VEKHPLSILTYFLNFLMKKIMKKSFLIKGIVALLVGFIIFEACNTLDLQPLDKVTTSTYYKTATDFDGATFAAYSSIQDLWGTSTETLSERGEFYAITLTATDDVDWNTKASNGAGGTQNNKDLDNLLIRASQTCWGAAYTQIYEGILRANLVIQAANGKDNELTAEQKTKFIAEAKFLRAIYHFLAMQMWGTPPIVTEIKTDIKALAVGNSTKDALFAAILSDLKDANAGLPDKWDAGNTGRATKWAAKAFEGKVNVWKKDWPAAIAAFEAVRAGAGYKLFDGNAAKIDNYEDAFDFSKENGVESIFEIQYGGPFSDDNLWVFDDTHSEAFKASQGTGRIWYWDPSGDAGAPGGGLGWHVPSKNLVDEYEAGDPRLTANIYKTGDTYYDRFNSTGIPYVPAWSSSTYTIRKYAGKRNAVGGAFSANGQASFNNERYFRYAELVLLYAEALIESGKTAEGVAIINNEIRKRVGLGASPIADARKALQHERRVELAFEIHRWFDITRWGIGAQVFGTKWDNKFNVFPFPQSEIDRSNGLLKQNTGY